MAALTETRIEGVPLLARGKVRDIYDLGDRLLLVATDRISAFDVVLPQPIPDKGKVLHQISRFWFEWFREVVPNHLVTDDVSEYPDPLPGYAAELRGRSAIVRKAKMFPVECVARGYITGSGWKEYQASGTVCGIALPAGLAHGDELPQPIFTPATKAESGHDENISYERMVEIVGADAAQKLRNLTLDLYSRAAKMAREKGLIIADTKFEFGVIDGEIAICDEMLTPDSSRFWPADEYEPGRAQPSFDKQYVRDFLETCTWDKTPPGPDLPDDVIEGTRARYVEALERISGRGLV